MTDSLNTIVTQSVEVDGHTFAVRYRRRQFVAAMRSVAWFVRDFPGVFYWPDAQSLSRKILADANRYSDARECQGK